MRTSRNHRLYLQLALLALMLAPALAFAADGGDDTLGLGDLLDWLVGLLRGPVGKLAAMVAFASAMFAGIGRGNIWGFVTGIVFAVVFYYGPNMVLNVFGAAL